MHDYGYRLMSNNIIVTQYNAHNNIFNIPLTFDFVTFTHATATFYNYTACIFV